ncbi:hypothetical protein MMC28_000743 [Mycoblastus sanguinarius]|nr:hypothetical protein [Mycoblastus sanguinarius]
MSNVHQERMVAGLSAVLESTKYSDLTVHCGPEEFKIHRAIVCPRSNFFDKLCSGGFKVRWSKSDARAVGYLLMRLSQEAETNEIGLEEDDPPTVRRMLTYLYTLDYDDDGEPASLKQYILNGSDSLKTTTVPEGGAQRHAKLMNNVAVYAIAEKYDIPELKELAKTKFTEILGIGILTPDIPMVVDAVFTITPDTDSGLRGVVIGACTRWAKTLVKDDGLNCMLKDHGELGLGVIRQMLGKRDALLKDLDRQVDSILKDARSYGTTYVQTNHLDPKYAFARQAQMYAFLLQKMETVEKISGAMSRASM